MKPCALILAILFLSFDLFSQSKIANVLTIYPDSAGHKISKHLYGHFSEHLGRCIYGGIWVGENSPIPNTRGIRNDIVAALKNISIPNLRWPGGCFADEYHWMDGIGPKKLRPKKVNTNWGGIVEDNSFGTHEFMDLCEQLGAEPVICGNIGSGSVKEMSEWVEYLTSDSENPMTDLRKRNGRQEPWRVKYWCVGNETWGCGGIMSAEHYSNEMARYSFFLKNYGKNTLYKISAGGLQEDYHWTETVMKKWSEAGGWLQGYLSGYSLHFYTVNDWSKKGSATGFSEKEWFTSLSKTLEMDELVMKHSAVMDKYDPQKKIGLVVDEWGNWFDVEKGTNPGFLYQQNTMRDAMVAALNLDIFNKHSSRVAMANIAQVVNVLQAVILTENEKMILTPTYHVFDLYKVHHDAEYIPFDLVSENYSFEGKTIPALSSTVSRDSTGIFHITVTNVHPGKDISVRCTIKGISLRNISGKILTSKNMQDHNTFEQPNTIALRGFKNFSVKGNEVEIQVPSKSVIMLELKNSFK